MKKLLCMTAVMTMLLASSVFAAAKINDEYKDLKTTSVPGTFMIEARGIFDILGYSCSWDANTKSTVFANGTDSISVVVGGAININGVQLQTNAAPIISDGVTYIPIDLLTNLGVDVGWDYENKCPLIYLPNYISNKDVKHGEWNSTKTEYYVDNARVTGEQLVDGILYNFGDDGILRTGIFTEGDTVYGYDEYGNPYNGFLTHDGKKYYFDNGIAYTKPTAIHEKLYNFASDGTLTIGWADIDGKKMYFNEFGYPVVGIVDIDNAKYYFIDGVMQTGAVVYNNKNYYFNTDGTMAINTYLNGYYYGSDGTGTQVSQAYMNLKNKANTILSQIGKSPSAIYRYVVGHVKYKYMAQQDWTTMATVGFNTGRGACYNFAACVDILLKQAGYETRVVRGTGHYTSLHYWNQVKINGAWTNIDACNKYYNVSDAYLKGKTYTFNKYEYPTYY